jgi:hypothetical protein
MSGMVAGWNALFPSLSLVKAILPFTPGKPADAGELPTSTPPRVLQRRSRSCRAWTATSPVRRPYPVYARVRQGRLPGSPAPMVPSRPVRTTPWWLWLSVPIVTLTIVASLSGIFVDSVYEKETRTSRRDVRQFTQIPWRSSGPPAMNLRRPPRRHLPTPDVVDRPHIEAAVLDPFAACRRKMARPNLVLTRFDTACLD